MPQRVAEKALIHTVRVQFFQFNCRRYDTMLERQHSFHDTGNTTRWLTMTHVGFNLYSFSRSHDDADVSPTDSMSSGFEDDRVLAKTLPIAVISKGSPTAVPVPLHSK